MFFPGLQQMVCDAFSEIVRDVSSEQMGQWGKLRWKQVKVLHGPATVRRELRFRKRHCETGSWEGRTQ